jgi:hypothetical protein
MDGEYFETTSLYGSRTPCEVMRATFDVNLMIGALKQMKLAGVKTVDMELNANVSKKGNGIQGFSAPYANPIELVGNLGTARALVLPMRCNTENDAEHMRSEMNRHFVRGDVKNATTSIPQKMVEDSVAADRGTDGTEATEPEREDGDRWSVAIKELAKLSKNVGV